MLAKKLIPSSRNLFSRSISGKTQWQSHLIPVSIQSKDCDKDRAEIEVEYASVEIHTDAVEDEVATILAFHPAGSSYKQFSKLPGLVPLGYANRVLGLNMYGYGRSQGWPEGLRTPYLTDLTAMVENVMEAEEKGQWWHLTGHSMGGGLALATAGLNTKISSRLKSLTAFEPNLFSLLLAGNSQELEQAEVGREFFSRMLKAADLEDWDTWGQTFYEFWFQGDWSAIDPGAQAKLVTSTLPCTIHEIKALMWGFDQGRDYAEAMLENLRSIQARKRIVLSCNPGPGSKDVSLAMAGILSRMANFEVVSASVGGHMSPLTHPYQVLPLMLP